MTREPEVLVIGGGATGVGVARDLALRDVDVALIDRDGLCGGTTGRSHGLLHSGARYADTDPEGAAECLAENRILRRIAGVCVRETGGLFLALDGDDDAYFDAKRDACDSVGIPVETVDPATARDRAPGLSADVERAMSVPDAVVSPSRLVAATALDADRHGATIHPHAPLESLTVRGERVTAARVGGRLDDVFRPDVVVNAAGAWAGEVAAMAGVTVAMQPTRGVMVSVDSEGIGPVLNRCRSPADGDIVVPHRTEAVLGTTSVPVRDPDDYDTPRGEIETVIDECAAMVPELADRPIVRHWWGVRPLYAPDEADRGGRGISRGFTLLDHADDGVDGFVTVVGGKLTTYRLMAESTADLVSDWLGVDASCRTADRELPAVDDPNRLDRAVATFDGAGPADVDLLDVPE
ncbi:glycerol-3-phosphate dehydrogenase [Halopenitus malekzadehii]|uniref:Glycerol-3-phosphate dehydrogenase n=1 Tax=Halopenitus malekzadehii TaxID=1267564 RepID=A0A1H6I030_9EURY|nr:FAD-dependent oxidoreductase [Halopenitus malekzadehii]SEH39823.1 glycerol-3-phosphate dehydrogenase [Halopenitus malekzadehii]